MFKLLVIVILMPSLAFGTWSTTSKDIILEESKKYHSHNNAAFISYWGGIRRYFSDKTNKGKIEKVKLPSLFEKDLGIYFFEDKGSDKLHVLFPGIFGSIEKEITKSLIRVLESMEGSVLVIPNFFSVPYLESKPIYGKKSMISDIQVPLAVIDKYNKSLKYRNIYLYAESLGTYIGSSTLARLSNRESYKKIKLSLTLMAPPIEINTALINFDREIAQSKPIFEDCSLVINGIKTLYYFINEFFPKKLDSSYIECMGSMLYHNAFVKSIKSSYKVAANYDENIEIENFFSYVKQTRPDLYKEIKSVKEETTLAYWLNKRNKSNTSVQIVTSSDDFLNISKDWEAFRKEISLDEDGLIVLPWGGHSGILAMPIWDKAFQSNL